MEAPTVSGSHGYQELCLAARNEEKRLAELAKRRWHHKTSVPPKTFCNQGGQTTSSQDRPPILLIDPGTSRRSNRKSEAFLQRHAITADSLAIWHGNVHPEEQRAVHMIAFRGIGQEVRSKFVQMEEIHALRMLAKTLLPVCSQTQMRVAEGHTH